MSGVNRKYVIPGEVVASGDLTLDANVVKIGDSVYSTRIGMAEISHNSVRVIPLCGPYAPREDDIVVGKVLSNSAMSWEVDINSFFPGVLPGSNVFGRDFSPDQHSLIDKFSRGDMIKTKVLAFDRTRDPMLTMTGPGLGKIQEGETVKISPTKVPRLIGKKGAMIRMIEVGSKTRLIIGQNGVIVLNGLDECIQKAKRAISLVEEEAHTADLTPRVQDLLGISQEDESN